MILAADGVPNLATAVWTLLGGTLAAGGANALNCYVDRDIDTLMLRTQHRPSVTGEISGPNIVRFGLVLSLGSVLVLATAVNVLSAVLSAVAIAFYVLGYTMLLKRRTVQNIVWGGAAGCMPVLIGWSAVQNRLEWAAFVLFMIVFLWTPPHYWPLSLRYRDDYARAGVPMLPVHAAPREVLRQILGYSWAMVAMSLVLIPVANMGVLYASIAVVLGGLFLWHGHSLSRKVQRGHDYDPMRLFHLSISYLSLIFLAVGADPFFN